jgi:predicted SAM-dependent methyltransferase
MFLQAINSLISLKDKLWLLPYQAQSRRTLTRYLRENRGHIRVNVGAGQRPLSGWLNGDIWPYAGTVYLDVQNKLPFEDTAVHVINCMHMVEHVSSEVCQAFFNECYRVLEPGGLLRVSTPSLEKLIRIYHGIGEPTHEQVLEHHRDYHQRPVDNICQWFNDHMPLWGHQFIFDEGALIHHLETAGFKDIVRCNFGESRHADLRGVEQHDEGDEWMRWAYVMIVEARKAG